MIPVWLNPEILSQAVTDLFDIENHGIWEATYGDADDEPILTLKPKKGLLLVWLGGWYKSSEEKASHYVWFIVMPDGTKRYFVLTRQEGQNDWFREYNEQHAQFLAASPKKRPEVNKMGFILVEVSMGDEYLEVPHYKVHRQYDAQEG